MNRTDRNRVETILVMVDTLMNKPPKENATITNADVVEAMYADLRSLLHNHPPQYLTELVLRDK